MSLIDILAYSSESFSGTKIIITFAIKNNDITQEVIKKWILSTVVWQLLLLADSKVLQMSSIYWPRAIYDHLNRLMTKPIKWYVRPAKIQISLEIRTIWSESSLSAWRKLGSLATHKRTAKTLIRLGWAHMPFCWFCHEVAHLHFPRKTLKSGK